MAGRLGLQAGLAAGNEAVGAATRLTFTTVLLIVAARLVLLFGAYVLDVGTAQRHHIEAAATLFVVLCMVLRYALSTSTESVVHRAETPDWLLWAGYCGLAFALYWPVVRNGLLSDDYVLFQRAAAFDLSAVSPTLFRPVPLALWSMIISLGGGPAVLHVLNIFLHGTNAFLTAAIALEWVPAPWAILAGLLVLASPLAPEAVAWCSGVFDASAACFVLSAVLIVRRYSAGHPTVGTRLALVSLLIAAVLCKETAAIGPLLVLVTNRVRGRPAGKLILDLALAAALIVVYATVRFALNPEPALFAVSKYALQRAMFSTFGSLAVPFHDDLRTSMPWLLILVTTLLATIWAAFSATRGPRRQLSLVITGLLWVLVSVSPAWSILVVSGDLQASRFLYLATAGWVLLVIVPAASLAATRPRLALLPMASVITVILIFGFAARAHLRPWQEAGRLRDRVLLAAAADARVRACTNVAIAGEPDHLRGAYVFRNGLAEALALQGIVETGSPRDPGCRFRWTAAGEFVIDRESGAPVSSR